MSDNVLMQLVEEFRRNSERKVIAFSSTVACKYAAQELESRINPCGYMPPLSEWPEWAKWCAVDVNGYYAYYSQEPLFDEALFWKPQFDTKIYEVVVSIEIPLGIDWRTLKVSRTQMEEYEDE